MAHDPALAGLWFRGILDDTVYSGALPIEIVECARIDGCGELKIFFRIAFPCMISGITTLALIFLWSWNSYLVPLVFVNSPKLYTVPVYIRSLGNAYRTDYAAHHRAAAGDDSSDPDVHPGFQKFYKGFDCRSCQGLTELVINTINCIEAGGVV